MTRFLYLVTYTWTSVYSKRKRKHTKAFLTLGAAKRHRYYCGGDSNAERKMTLFAEVEGEP